MIIDLSDKEKKKALIKLISDLDGKYDVNIDHYTGNENQMRALYFKTIVNPLMEHIGLSKDEAHEIIKNNVNPGFEYFKIDLDGTTKKFTKDDWKTFLLLAEKFLYEEMMFKTKNDL